MKHIFISYKHEDGDFAENLVYKIKEAGFQTWVDNDLNAGDDWRTKIDQAIKDACALIVIMSPEARASEYVTYEWAFAWGAGVKVIPVGSGAWGGWHAREVGESSCMAQRSPLN